MSKSRPCLHIWSRALPRGIASSSAVYPVNSSCGLCDAHPNLPTSRESEIFSFGTRSALAYSGNVRHSELLDRQHAQFAVATTTGRRLCTSSLPQLLGDTAMERNEDVDDTQGTVPEVAELKEDEHDPEDAELKEDELDHRITGSRDACTIHDLCRVLEGQVWGSNIEDALQTFAKDLSPHIVGRVVLRQKGVAMSKCFFQWASKQMEQDTESYHSLLWKLGQAQQVAEMWELLHEMRGKGIPLKSTSFSILIKAHGAAGRLNEALEIINRTHEFNVPLDIHIYTTLLSALFKAKLVQQAKDIHQRMVKDGCQLDTSAYSTLIRGFGKNGSTEEALNCFDEMVQGGGQPNLSIYNALIEGFCESKALNKALFTFVALQEKGFKPNVYTYNPLLGALCVKGRFAEAINMFSSMKNICLPNQATFNILLQGLFLNEDVSKAIEFFELMEREGWADGRSYSLCATGLMNAKQTNKLMSMSKMLYNKHGTVQVSICNSLLQRFLVARNNLNEVEDYFNKMVSGMTQPNVASYSTMISCYIRFGKLEEAMKLVSAMQGPDCKPNELCYTPLIKALLKAGRVGDGAKLFEEMLERCLESNDVTCDYLLMKLSEDSVLKLCKHIMENSSSFRNLTLITLMKCVSKRANLKWLLGFSDMRKRAELKRLVRFSEISINTVA